MAYLKVACRFFVLNIIVQDYGFTHDIHHNVYVFAVPMPSAKADDDVMLITAVSSDLDDISVSNYPFGSAVVSFNFFLRPVIDFIFSVCDRVMYELYNCSKLVKQVLKMKIPYLQYL